MALAIGTRLSAYEVVAASGETRRGRRITTIRSLARRLFGGDEIRLRGGNAVVDCRIVSAQESKR
jgi:hypothetical protein